VVEEPAVKRLVVTADDVGLDPGITRGALLARAEGIVTSLSVLTARPDWETTAEALREAGAREVGVHLTLCEGSPVLPASELPSLVDPEGRFPHRLGAVLSRVVTRRLDWGEVRREWLAQVARAREAGLEVTHLDGHKHVHLAPGLCAIALEVLRESGVPGFRLSSEPGRGPRRALRASLGVLSRRCSRRLAGHGGRSTDRVAGIAQAGRLDTSGLVSLLERLPEGTTELISHPGQLGETLPSRLLDEGLDWAADYGFGQELQALTSSAAQQAIERCGIELTSWGELLSG